jgi:hypothetical protein
MIVAIFYKDFLTVVAPLDSVMGNTWIYEPTFSCHEEKVVF